MSGCENSELTLLPVIDTGPPPGCFSRAAGRFIVLRQENNSQNSGIAEIDNFCNPESCCCVTYYEQQVLHKLKNKKMKKIIIILALVLTISSSFAFTGREVINQQALYAFKTEFAGATDATWMVSNNFYKVAFTMNGHKLFAYYNRSGEFMAVTRYISSFQLPHYLQKKLKKSWSNYWISDLFKISNHDETSYYVTLETADSKMVLKSDNGSNWVVFQKTEKI
jgi:hypothetical protein